MKRTLAGLMILYTGFSLSAEQDMAYLIIKATLQAEEKQPTWICMARFETCVHIPADEDIVEIEPGRYRLHHVDFENSVHLGDKSRFFRKSVNFDFEAGNIYFIGNLKLEKKKLKRYEMELDQNTNLIKKACVANPELFEILPVNDLTGSKKLRVSCSKTSDKNT